jgi:hypothetical protein
MINDNKRRMVMASRKTTVKKTTARAKAPAQAPTALPAGPMVPELGLTVAEVNVLMSAALLLPQARGSKDYHTMNGAITKLQHFMMQSMPQGTQGMPPPA